MNYYMPMKMAGRGKEASVNETIHNMNDIHVGRNIRKSGLAAKQHSSAYSKI